MKNPLKLGMHLVSPRTGYSHHGIYIGRNKIIHYAGLSDGLESGPVEKISLENFCSGNGYSIIYHSNAKFFGKDIVARAQSRLGENLYSITNNNCEHFCEWCITGSHDSLQVDMGTVVVGAGTSVTAAGAGLAIVSSAGVAAGLSGAGTMSGLAAVGGTVGAGAVSGLAILGAAPALAMASLINNTVLADNPSLNKKERKARSNGRSATYLGAAAGTASSIAAVSTAGSVAGLSAAGVTSGLAAIGGTVGGGMAAGVAVTVAAPVAAAAAIGYGAYKFFKWLSD